MPKKVIISYHAMDRLEERGISENNIMNVIQSPDNTHPSFKERQIASKSIRSQLITVVFKEELDNIIVITVY
ncbi:MAG: DUF4258 domain-containing protein [archaeon]